MKYRHTRLIMIVITIMIVMCFVILLKKFIDTHIWKYGVSASNTSSSVLDSKANSRLLSEINLICPTQEIKYLVTECWFEKIMYHGEVMPVLCLKVREKSVHSIVPCVISNSSDRTNDGSDLSVHCFVFANGVVPDTVAINGVACTLLLKNSFSW